MNKIQTIVVKNSLPARQILRDNGFNHGSKVNSELDNEEYLVLGLMNIGRNARLGFYSVNADFFENYLNDNPFCPYVKYATDFVKWIDTFKTDIAEYYKLFDIEEMCYE